MYRLDLWFVSALVGGAAASVADQVAAAQIGARLLARFGSADVDQSSLVTGSVRIQLGGSAGYQAVNWTTTAISLPGDLVRSICGPMPREQSFTYSVNEKWGHGDGRLSGQGPEECGVAFTGGHWDPTAACSSMSANGACEVCGTKDGYRCSPELFDPAPDASGSGAYRFLNEHACELGDLSGMGGELAAEPIDVCPEDQSASCEEWARKGECKASPDYLNLLCPRACGACADPAHVALPGSQTGLAQMSTPFGVVSRESVTTSLIGINCDASGPPPVHGTNCRCLEFNGKKSESIGTLTVFKPWDHETFYLGGAGLEALEGRSVVVQCGSTFGDKKGRPLACAKLHKDL